MTKNIWIKITKGKKRSYRVEIKKSSGAEMQTLQPQLLLMMLDQISKTVIKAKKSH